MGDPATLYDFVALGCQYLPRRPLSLISPITARLDRGWTVPDPSYDYLDLNELIMRQPVVTNCYRQI